MRDSIARIAAMTASWTAADFERTYAPGKWSARRILTHLAQSEVALGFRARMTLATPNYTSQNFDQDAWMLKESSLAGRDAVNALVALATMNVALFSSLTPADREMPLTHPEYGQLTVDWIIHQMAGHQIHHLKQLDSL
jgi:DinB superfamily